MARHPSESAASGSKIFPSTSIANADVHRSDRQRTHSLWKVAVSATKGLFHGVSSSASRADGLEMRAQRNRSSSLTESIDTKPALHDSKRKDASFSRTLWKSRSSPSLKHDAAVTPSTSCLRPPVPALAPTSSSSQASNIQRPIISCPSSPRRYDPLEPHTTISLLPNSGNGDRKPIFATVLKHKAPVRSSPLRDQSNLSLQNCTEPAVSTAVNLASYREPSRRRTKSTPGIKLSRRTVGGNSPNTSTEPQLRPSPSASSLYSTSASSAPFQAIHVPQNTNGLRASPAPSICSVKRKPVPRFLYTDPPDHEASTPSSPSLTTIPDLTPLQTPLLSSTEIILSALSSRGGERDITLLPIGRGSAKKPDPARRRSASAHRYEGDGLWFNMSPVANRYDPYGEPRTVPLIISGLSPPPSHTRALSNQPQVILPDCASQETSASNALSPLTDEEVTAIRTFLRNHDTGPRARQRRKRPSNAESPLASYDMHTEILESYLDLNLTPISDSSSQITSSSECEDRQSIHTEPQEADDELSTPMDLNHRGTFGYGEDTFCIPEPEVVSDADDDHHFIVDLRSLVDGHETYDDVSQVPKSMGNEEELSGLSSSDDEPCFFSQSICASQPISEAMTTPTKDPTSPKTHQPLGNFASSLKSKAPFDDTLFRPFVSTSENTDHPEPLYAPGTDNEQRHSSAHLIGRPITRRVFSCDPHADVNDSNDLSSSNDESDFYSTTLPSSLDRLNTSLLKLKSHSPSLNNPSVSTLLGPPLPITPTTSSTARSAKSPSTWRDCQAASTPHKGAVCSPLNTSRTRQFDAVSGVEILTPPRTSETSESVSSFIHLTPDDSPPKHWTRARLRKLLRRAAKATVRKRTTGARS